MGCSCNKIGRMSKRSKSLEMEDLAFGVLGAVAGLALNPILNKVVQNQAEATKNLVGTALPLAKGVAGGVLATQKKQSRKLRFFGLGMVAESSLELAIKAKPELFSIGGTGDVYRAIGNSNVMYPILPGATMEESSSEMPFVSEPILGTATATPVL